MGARKMRLGALGPLAVHLPGVAERVFQRRGHSPETPSTPESPERPTADAKKDGHQPAREIDARSAFDRSMLIMSMRMRSFA